MNKRHTKLDTTLGSITIVASDESITGLYFERHACRPSDGTFGTAVAPSEDPLLASAVEQLHAYLQGSRQDFDLPLSASGNDFQRAVWAIVSEVPFGATTTYGQIAEQLGDRLLAQDVGQAVGANPLCVFVPCHRVVGSSGALTGYAGGLSRKRALLELEQPAPVAAGRLFS